MMDIHTQQSSGQRALPEENSTPTVHSKSAVWIVLGILIAIFLLLIVIVSVIGHQRKGKERTIFVPTSIPSITKASVQTKTTISCANVDRNPPELTFEVSYCNGDYCRDAKNKVDCESRDMIKIQDNAIVSRKDGKGDCTWLPAQQFCTPNL